MYLFKKKTQWNVMTSEINEFTMDVNNKAI